MLWNSFVNKFGDMIYLMYWVLSSLCQGRTCLGGAQLWGYREANLILNHESMYFYIFVYVLYARVLKLCENPASVSVTQSYLFSYLILVIILMTKAIHLIVCLMFWLLTILFIFEIAILNLILSRIPAILCNLLHIYIEIDLVVA